MYEDLFRTVQEATQGAYDVFGELGHDERRVAYLARESGSGGLVVLALAFDADEIDVIPRLGPEVPMTGTLCPACGSPTLGLDERCAACGAGGVRSAGSGPDAGGEAMLHSVRSAAAGTYDVLGYLEQARGAPVYFARESGSGRLVGLALQRDAAEREGFSLVLVWEGSRAPGGAVRVPEPEPAPPPAAAYVEPWPAAPVPEEPTDPMLGRARAEEVEEVERPAAGRRRSGVLLTAGVAVLALGGLAVLALRGTGADARPPQEPTRVATAPPPVLPAPPVAAPVDSAPAPAPVQEPAPRPQPERRPDAPAARPREDANRSARVIIDGRLPAGWTATVNGGGSSSGGVVELRPRRASTIVVDAPGFCTETRTFQLSPGEEYRWVLRMRERPLVGAC